MSAWPRTLVVSQAHIRGNSNTAVTLGSLLADWPLDRIRYIYADEDRPEGPDEHGDWNLTLRSVPVYRLLIRPSFRRWVRQELTAPGIPSGIGCGSRGSMASEAEVARAWADLLPYNVPEPLWQWLRAFSPEVVFSPLGSIRWISLVAEIALALQARIVPDFRDDWPEVFYRFSRWARVPRSALTRRLHAMLRNVSVVTCGSDQMAREYSRRYGVHAEGFMRCVDTVPHRPALRPSTDVLRLSYVGGLHLKRWEVLDQLGHALERLRLEGVSASLSIYAPARDVLEHRGRLIRPDIVDVVGTLAPSDVPSILAAADVLVHVESFDETIARFTRLSLSTKLPEYLASGKPLLGIGPPSLASIQYILECGAGLVVAEQNADVIATAVRHLAGRADLRTALGEAGWQAARSRHDGDKERERFRALLSRVAAGKSAPASSA